MNDATTLCSNGIPAIMSLVERLEPALDAVEVFRRLAQLPHVVFLDSAVSRWPDRPLLVRRRRPDPLVGFARSSFAEIEDIAARLGDPWRPVRPAALPRRARRHVWLRACAAIRARARRQDRRIPLAGRWPIGWYDVVVAFDHEQNAAWLISQGGAEVDPAARLAKFRQLLHGELASDFGELSRAASGEPAHALPPLPLSELSPQYPTGIENLTSTFSADGYLRAVRRAIEYIYAGDVYQVNLAQRLLHPAHGSASRSLLSSP